MRRSVILAVAAVLALSSAPFGVVAQTAPQASDYTTVLADPVRKPEDRARDEARHTAETLAFAGVAPGQKVVDMIIGGGYFTRIFSAAVGPEGEVIAWQPTEFIAFEASYETALAEVEALPNVHGVRTSIGMPEFPSGVDLVFTAQNYHDLHLRPFPGDTARKVNERVFAALKPGGRYVIIDHNAVAGSDILVAHDLHRIDVETVKREVTAAGFVLDGESDVLENSTDPLTGNVFAPEIRGQTSQFMLRFRKPG